MVTINDIAKRAGVAKSTVSRYLNNGSISPKTRKKIDQIVAETGYKPNAFARSLKAQRTNMLGVIIPRLNSPSTNNVLAGIDEAAREQGYQLIITNADQNTERELENIHTLAKQKVEAILLLAREITPAHIEAIKEVGIPFLLIGQKAKGIHSMIHADYEAGVKMAEYALELGHHQFLFIGVPEEDEAVGIYRKNGFIDTVRKRGATVQVEETSFSRTYTYQRALQFLPEYDATYVACATDNIAVAVLKAANELGYSVPEDFSLSGFGGYEATVYSHPTITTVSYPYRFIGKQAVENIQALIEGREIPIETICPNELTVQKSTIPVRKEKVF
jgi:LacI family sucrose operon transcriptional repressor